MDNKHNRKFSSILAFAISGIVLSCTAFTAFAEPPDEDYPPSDEPYYTDDENYEESQYQDEYDYNYDNDNDEPEYPDESYYPEESTDYTEESYYYDEESTDYTQNSEIAEPYYENYENYESSYSESSNDTSQYNYYYPLPQTIYESYYQEDDYIQNYDEYYAEDGNDDYYDIYAAESKSPASPPSEHSQFISDNSVDTTELTSEDWETLKNGGLENSGSNGFKLTSDGSEGNDFASIKEHEESSNDAWQYLVFGITLIVLGAGIISAIIITTIKAKKRLNTLLTYPQESDYDTDNNKEKIKNKKSKKSSPKDLGDTLDEPLDFSGFGFTNMNKDNR